jgi:hypothetical protein
MCLDNKKLLGHGNKSMDVQQNPKSNMVKRKKATFEQRLLFLSLKCGGCTQVGLYIYILTVHEEIKLTYMKRFGQK